MTYSMHSHWDQHQKDGEGDLLPDGIFFTALRDESFDAPPILQRGAEMTTEMKRRCRPKYEIANSFDAACVVAVQWMRLLPLYQRQKHFGINGLADHSIGASWNAVIV